MANIFITRLIPDAGLLLLKKAGHKTTIYKGENTIPHDALLASVKGVDAILSLLTETIDRAVFDAAGSQLKIVANYAVGFDNIDLETAKARRVVITNAPCEEVSEAVAEHTFALMLALAHRIAEADVYAKTGHYKGWDPLALLGTDVHGKTLGIVGAGRIGCAVLQRAVIGFGMRCLYADIKPNKEMETRFQAERIPLDALLRVSDFVSLHVPLLPSTRHLISTDQFSLMKKTAFLINTARGPIVDEKALLRALRTRRIAGAALDVFECEPGIDCDITDNLALKQFSNVILTPHIASGTIEARQAMSRIAAENILAVLEGKPALTPAK